MRGQVRTYGSALKYTLRHSSGREIGRRPLEVQASALISQLPPIDLSEVAGDLTFTATMSVGEGRHAWSLHACDQLLLQAIMAARKVRTAFEIGTFNGGTTRLIAEAIGDDGQVWTLDLPPAEFDATLTADSFHGSDVGCVYRDSDAASKITQILQDSLTFDPSPYQGRCDLVLVDGAHDYAHGLADTRTAFELVASDGLILWDDFQPFWHGLIRGIFEAAGHRRPRRLAGSNMGVWAADLPETGLWT
jgi:hypothetical protein